MRYSRIGVLGCLGAVLFGMLLAVPTSGRTGAQVPTLAASVAYQGNPTHDGSLSGSSLAPPLQQAWAVNLGQPTSYALASNNMVYVTVRNVSSYGTRLYALDAQSGATVWGPVALAGTYYWSALTAEGGQIFALNFDGLLRAFNAQTGTPGWSVQLPGQYAFSSPPTALNGTVYIGGAGSGGTVYAVDETNGNVRWTAPVANGDNSSPAVTGTGVYVAYPCQTYDLNPANGQVIWHRDTQCSGGGGRTPAVYSGRVFDRENGVVLDAATGALLGTLTAGPIPAFLGNQSFTLASGTLRSNDLSSGGTLWSFTGDGALASAPLVVNNTVYIGSGGSRLYGLDPQSGALVYSTTLPAPVLAPDEQNASQPLTGFGASTDLLVVPASSWIVAFRAVSGSPTATSTPGGPTATPTATGTATPTPSPSATPGTPPPTPPDQSVTYQIDSAHTGNLPGDSLTPPLRQIWTRNLGTRVSYPLIVGSRAYVAAGDVGGTTLYAVDLQTGANVWGPIPLGTSWGELAYDDGQIFAVGENGIERALDAQTGQQHWIVQLPYQYLFSSPPSARNGIVYTGGAGSGGTVYAVRESDGTLLWTASVENGDHSSPAVSDTGVYVSYACEQTYDFAPGNGQLIWHYSTNCEGGGGRTPVLYNNRLYIRDDAGMTPAILDAGTGTLVGTYASGPAPAFEGNLGFYRNGATLQAVDLGTGGVVWSFAGDGALTSAPIVVNHTVYIGSGGSHLYGLDPATGAVRYTGPLPAPVEAPDEHNLFELPGLSAGSGTLLVPAGTWLAAFTTDTGTSTPTPTPGVSTSTPTATPSSPVLTPTPAPTSTATASPTARPTLPPSVTATPARPTATPVPPSATPTVCSVAFGDLHPTDYFYGPVLYLACHGVISGYADGTFRPYNNTTRAQMVKIVVLGFGKAIVTPNGGAYTFADVPPPNPFFAVIETAAADTIVSGYTCGGPGEPCDAQHRPYFRPYANVTRGQLSKIDLVAAGWALQNPPTGNFADVLPGTAFYAFVETAYCHGVISGYACGGPGEPCDAGHHPYFRQYNPATRGQIAKIVYLSITGSENCAGPGD